MSIKIHSRVTNREVIEAWLTGGYAHNGGASLVVNTEGELFSSGLKVGQRTKSGRTILADFTTAGGRYITKEVSRHVNLARRSADLIVHPVVWNTMLTSNIKVPF